MVKRYKREKTINRKSACVLMALGVMLVFSALIYIGHTNSRIQNTEDSIERAERIFLRDSYEADAVDNDISTGVDTGTTPEEAPADTGECAQKYKNAIGFLEISKLNLNLPIFPDTSQKSLKNGVGIVAGTDVPRAETATTAVIAGHRGGYNGRMSFRYIDRLSQGDEIKVITAACNLVYRVIGSEVIEPTDWSKFKHFENKNLLILMACHPYPKNDKRLLIYAEAT